MTAYVPTTWVNGSTGGTPLSAANLNKLTNELELQAAAIQISHTLPNWTDGVAPALTDPAPLNEMERVVDLVSAALQLSYTPTVWQSGWTPARNASNFQKLEQAAMATSAVLEPFLVDVDDSLALTDAVKFARGQKQTETLTMNDARSVIHTTVPPPVLRNIGDSLARTDARTFIRGRRITDSVSLTDARTVVESSAGELKWTPPGYNGTGNPRLASSFPGYTAITLNNATARRTLTANTDYHVTLPATPITVDGGVLLSGGRNVVIVGGEIFDSTVLTQAQASASELWRQIGLYVVGQTGTVHIEGLWIHGDGCGDAISTGNGSDNTIMHIQNCRLHNNHNVQNSSTTGWDGAHPDTFQCWAGPSIWGMYQNTMISSGTFRTWQPQSLGGQNIDSVHIERANILAQQKFGAYALWDNMSSGWWPEYHWDIWFSYGQSGNFYRNGDVAHSQWDPPNRGVTGQAVNYGVRPQGDWIPAPTVSAPTTCGVNYVSPGYQ